MWTLSSKLFVTGYSPGEDEAPVERHEGCDHSKDEHRHLQVKSFFWRSKFFFLDIKSFSFWRSKVFLFGGQKFFFSEVKSFSFWMSKVSFALILVATHRSSPNCSFSAKAVGDEARAEGAESKAWEDKDIDIYQYNWDPQVKALTWLSDLTFFLSVDQPIQTSGNTNTIYWDLKGIWNAVVDYRICSTDRCIQKMQWMCIRWVMSVAIYEMWLSVSVKDGRIRHRSSLAFHPCLGLGVKSTRQWQSKRQSTYLQSITKSYISTCLARIYRFYSFQCFIVNYSLHSEN